MRPIVVIAALPVLVVGLCRIPSAAGADQPAPPQQKAPSPTKPAAEEDELLKAIDPNAVEEESELSRITRAIEGMRTAQSKIEARDAGKATQEVQARVVKDLEELIRQLQEQQQTSSSSPKKKEQNKNQKQKQMIQSGKQQDPQNSTAQSKAEQQSGGQRSEEASRDSTERTEKGEPVAPDLAAPRKLAKDVWGHLPPALREELLNVYSEKYLPKYEDLVRRYYEALATKNKNRSR
jgi:hypothetical protein